MVETEKAAAARDDGWAVACLELRTAIHPGRSGLWYRLARLRFLRGDKRAGARALWKALSRSLLLYPS